MVKRSLLHTKDWKLLNLEKKLQNVIGLHKNWGLTYRYAYNGDAMLIYTLQSVKLMKVILLGAFLLRDAL